MARAEGVSALSPEFQTLAFVRLKLKDGIAPSGSPQSLTIPKDEDLARLQQVTFRYDYRQDAAAASELKAKQQELEAGKLPGYKR